LCLGTPNKNYPPFFPFASLCLMFNKKRDEFKDVLPGN